ncbi:MAG: hypothetical protein FWG91_06290 [Lachnospiraceae bacterium]|nr:hypothetical protein [Lachnospiraceae bacterium]
MNVNGFTQSIFNFNPLRIDQVGQYQNKASNTSLAQDRIASKIQVARRNAMRLIKDAFESDQKNEKSLNSREQKVKDIRSEFHNNEKDIKFCEAETRSLMEQYEIKSDSQEQKALEYLIEIQRTVNKTVIWPRKYFTKDEVIEISDFIRENGITEYQRRALDVDVTYAKAVSSNQDLDFDIRMENAIISTSKIEQLKHRSMLNATEASQELLDDTSKNAIEIAFDDAKKYLEEKADENQSKAEQLAEAQKNREKIIKKIKDEEDDENENSYFEITKKMLSLEKEAFSIQAEVKKIGSKMGVIEDYLKGVKIDKNA